MRALDGLTDAQAEAVTAPGPYLCLLACPGSGKTRVLTHRIAYQAEAGVADPRHVLALTFTRRAAAELSARTADLGVAGPIAAGTLHGIALRQLRQWAADHGEGPPVVIDRGTWLHDELAKLGDSASNGLDVATLDAEIGWAKARALGPECYEASARLPAPLATAVCQAYADYEARKHRARVLDLDDLVGRCADLLLSDSSFAEAQRWRFQHLFVDEYQDLNPAHARLLDAWLGEQGWLSVVGDPDQAIFGWNGADPSLLATFSSRYVGARVIRLDANFRSTPEIQSVARAVLGGGVSAPAGLGRTTHSLGEIPLLRSCATAEEEATFVAGWLTERHARGWSWTDLAVLARTHEQLETISRRLSSWSIPVNGPQRGPIPMDGPQRAIGSVTLATLHQAKGLEWSCVAVTGLEDGLVPLNGAGTDPDEERRLLYVALTRAKHELACTWSLSRSVHGQLRMRRASPFLEVITQAVRELARSREASLLGHPSGYRISAQQIPGALSGRESESRRMRSAIPSAMLDRSAILAELMAWRAQRARAARVEVGVIASDETLEALADSDPASVAELAGIPRLDRFRAARWGSQLLGILHNGRPDTGDALAH